MHDIPTSIWHGVCVIMHTHTSNVYALHRVQAAADAESARATEEARLQEEAAREEAERRRQEELRRVSRHMCGLAESPVCVCARIEAGRVCAGWANQPGTDAFAWLANKCWASSRNIPRP